MYNGVDLHRVDSAGRMVLGPGWSLPFHSHDHNHELVLVVEGGIETARHG